MSENNYAQNILARLDNLSLEVAQAGKSIDIAEALQAVKNVAEGKKNEISALAESIKAPHERDSYRLLHKINTSLSLMIQEVKRNEQGEIVKYGDILSRGVDHGGSSGAGRGNLGHFTRVNLPDNLEIIEVYGGHHTLYALPKEGNDLYVWGANYHGCSGANRTDNLTTPIKITLPIRAKDIQTGQTTTNSGSAYILGEDGNLYCSGYNGYGQLGLGNTLNLTTFTKNPYLSGITKFFVSSDGTRTSVYCINEDGDLWVFGNNEHGQLGLGNTTNTHTPKKITFSKKVVDACGAMRSDGANAFIILEDGSALACGNNAHRQLSTSHLNTSASFIPLESAQGELQDIVKIYPQTIHGTIFALDKAGNLYAWGHGRYGYGDSTAPQSNISARVVARGVKDFKQNINYGTRAYIRLKSGLMSFGRNNNGGLALGDTTDRNTFSPIALNGDDFAVYGVDDASIFCIRRGDRIYACGGATYGELLFASNTLQRQL